MRSLHSFSLLFLLLVAWGDLVTAKTVCHDETFVPDAVLRITAKNITQSCLPSKLTVLVNGTTPGPALTLKEGVTYWIRVYNDQTDSNLTMVMTSKALIYLQS